MKRADLTEAARQLDHLGMTALWEENKQLRSALERADGCIRGLIARTPVRDVPETLAEIERALKRLKACGD